MHFTYTHVGTTPKYTKRHLHIKALHAAITSCQAIKPVVDLKQVSLLSVPFAATNKDGYLILVLSSILN